MVSSVERPFKLQNWIHLIFRRYLSTWQALHISRINSIPLLIWLLKFQTSWPFFGKKLLYLLDSSYFQEILVHLASSPYQQNQFNSSLDMAAGVSDFLAFFWQKLLYPLNSSYFQEILVHLACSPYQQNQFNSSLSVESYIHRHV